jgi:hypothetical protein
MAGMNWDKLSAEERLVAEQAILNLRALSKACRAAPDGKVLGVAERLAVEQGRELTRRTLQAALESEGREAEKKGPRAGRARAD